MTPRRLIVAVLAVLLGVAVMPAAATDPAASAIDNKPRIWRALTGDMLELDGTIMRLRGVRCPDELSDRGRAAKALLNTFLRGGEINCRVWQTPGGPEASCAKEGRDVAKGMIQSGLCEPRLGGGGPRRDARASPHLQDNGLFEIKQLRTAQRDRRQIHAELCQLLSQYEQPDLRFYNRCHVEVVRNAIEIENERLLSRESPEINRPDPFPNSLFFQ